MIRALLDDHDRRVTYLSSDEADPGLALEHPGLKSFNIGAGSARTILFARMDCSTFVMTLPDLGNLWLKRSVHPVRYVYLFHSMNSTHTSYRKGAFDNFDTVLCVGPHHVEEIRRTEEVYGLPPKELVEHGSTKLDAVISELAGSTAQPTTGGQPRVLIAPTWGESSLIERPEGSLLIRALLDAGVPTVLRLHPMTSRRLPRLADDLNRQFAEGGAFRLEQDMNASD